MVRATDRRTDGRQRKERKEGGREGGADRSQGDDVAIVSTRVHIIQSLFGQETQLPRSVGRSDQREIGRLMRVRTRC